MVTGRPASGKSTTLDAMIDKIKTDADDPSPIEDRDRIRAH